jgi:hypothetical protein
MFGICCPYMEDSNTKSSVVLRKSSTVNRRGAVHLGIRRWRAECVGMCLYECMTLSYLNYFSNTTKQSVFIVERLIECNAKCRYLKNLPVKGLCVRCFICLRPPSLL